MQERPDALGQFLKAANEIMNDFWLITDDAYEWFAESIEADFIAPVTAAGVDDLETLELFPRSLLANLVERELIEEAGLGAADSKELAKAALGRLAFENTLRGAVEAELEEVDRLARMPGNVSYVHVFCL